MDIVIVNGRRDKELEKVINDNSVDIGIRLLNITGEKANEIVYQDSAMMIPKGVNLYYENIEDIMCKYILSKEEQAIKNNYILMDMFERGIISKKCAQENIINF